MMESEVPLPDIRGHRTLAAIVFTDGVDFSARMAVDEDHILDLIRRDFKLMKDLCLHYEGQVLKSTGDGLLMYFVSAVQAVACANEIQKSLTEAAANLPPKNVLVHRIGIHLGDVFFSETDVMGNGVNIAARLQAEAEPGGICISQTVYDVVKNRLALKATFLGPRELKNIQEAVPVYQILLASHTEKIDVAASKTLPAQPSAISSLVEEVPRVSPVPMPMQEKLRALLAKSIGPMGPILLETALAQAHTLQEVTDYLLLQIPAAQQNEFRAWLQLLQAENSTPCPEVDSERPVPGLESAVLPSPVTSLPEFYLPTDVRERLEKLLTQTMGPMAPLLLQYSLEKIHTLRDLIEHLTAELPPDSQPEFRIKLKKLLEAPDLGPAQTLSQFDSPRSSSTQQDLLDPAFIKLCQQELAHCIGPIASFILQETLTQYPKASPQQLVEALVIEIPNPLQAAEFRQRLLF